MKHTPHMHSSAHPLRLSAGRVALCAAAVAGTWLATSGNVLAEVRFDRQVMSVLSKAGCNAGVCHGNQNGKGGFKLSLRGQDPRHDYAALARDQFGRRADRLDPDGSLMLLKAAGRVAHGGGRRFDRDSPQYKILREWIAGGLRRDDDTPPLVRLDVSPGEQVVREPDVTVRLRVTATFADGSTSDVSGLSVYEPSNRVATVDTDGTVRRADFGETTIQVRYLQRIAPVRLAFVPRRADFQWSNPPEHNYIDRHVFAKLRRLRVNPSELCDDHVFVRRAYLDALGILPTADEARKFVADGRADKRRRLVDALLARPEFADWWALKWADLLRVEEKLLDQKGVQAFHSWIRRSMAEGKPLDRFVREIVSARGSTYKHPPANFYRSLRDPVKRGETTAQLFLGVRIGCAKCHNHPFERWTQDDYYGWAGLFARVDYKIISNQRRDKLDNNEFNGEQIVLVSARGEVTNARTGKPAKPTYLGGAAAGDSAAGDRITAAAEWITSPDNPFFARAQANRIWYHVTGRGIVDPIDDFRATNPPSNPALLEALAKDLAEHRFDPRHLVRRIMNSRAYQLSAVPNETNRDDELNFSRAVVRRMSAEQLLDAIHAVAGVPAKFNGYSAGVRAGQLSGTMAARRRDKRPTGDDQFLTTFGKPARILSCECERSDETTLGQTFVMISGRMINQLLANPESRLARLAASDRPAAEIVEEVYWTALGRPPSEEERREFSEYIEQAKDRAAAVQDVAWAVLNAKEFVLRR